MKKKDSTAIDFEFTNEVEAVNEKKVKPHNEVNDSDEKVILSPPRSPKKSIKGNMLRRVNSIMETINKDTLSDIALNMEENSGNTYLDTNKTTALLKSPKRNTSIRIIKKDQGAKIDDLEDLNDLDEGFLNSNKGSPYNKTNKEKQGKESVNKNEEAKEGACPPSPKKNMSQKIKRKDNEMDNIKKSNKVRGDLDDFDNLSLSPKHHTTAVHTITNDDNKKKVDDKEKKYKSDMCFIEESNLEESLLLNDEIDLGGNGFYRSQSTFVNEFQTPKHETHEKAINNMLKSSPTPEIPKSPKRNTSTRIKLNSVIMTETLKSKEAKIEEETNFTLYDDKHYSDQEDEEQKVSNEPLFESNNNVQLPEKLKLLESKIKVMEQSHLKERNKMEAKLFVVEQSNLVLNNEYR